MPTYLIQGFFFRNGERGAFAHLPQNDAIALRTGILRYLYSGVIFPDLNNLSTLLVGELEDNYDIADLSEITVTEDAIRFVKTYRTIQDIITYQLERKDGYWEGTWTNVTRPDRIETGITRCVVTHVPDEFFVLPKQE